MGGKGGPHARAPIDFASDNDNPGSDHPPGLMNVT
jgi:hypothetical protein